MLTKSYREDRRKKNTGANKQETNVYNGVGGDTMGGGGGVERGIQRVDTERREERRNKEDEKEVQIYRNGEETKKERER